MELKVWVDGIQRIVCGVTQATTCQDVVFALAHATSTTGRFTLIERWRSNERLLAPSQHPLKVLLKWGEHASDVQFILQRTSLNYRDGHNLDNKAGDRGEHGVQELQIDHAAAQQRNAAIAAHNRNNIHNNNVQNEGVSPLSSTGGSGGRDIRKSLTFSGAMVSREGRVAGRGGPPYDPAKVDHSPAGLPDLERTTNLEEDADVAHCSDGRVLPDSSAAVLGRQVEHVVLDNIHQDLVTLVNKQRDQLTGQQILLTKFEAEITYLEGRWREDQAKLSFANAEMERLSLLLQKLDEELGDNDPSLEEEELKSALNAKEQLSREMSTVHQQLQQCDAQIAHLTHSVTSLEDELVALRVQSEDQQQLEGALQDLSDAEAADTSAQPPSPELAKMLMEVESALAGKREQVEELKRAMMTENLEALSLTPPDRLAAAPHAPASGAAATGAGGSGRRMLGPPRMLETAVPTSKNPHGVWV